MSSPSKQHVIGGKDNFWLYFATSSSDLTHPSTPCSPRVTPRINLNTSKEPIALDPKRTELLPIDIQNYFLSPALRRPADSLGLEIVNKLSSTVIPACRATGIRTAWMMYGLTDEDMRSMPPMMIASTSEDSNLEDGEGGGRFGGPLGKVIVDGEEIDAGRCLVRDQWNSRLYASLEVLRAPEDLTLKDQDIRTLVFAGANLDQCVASTLLDAFHQGFDVVLLSDGAATTSPEFATRCIQRNCELGWGFLVSCEEFRRGAMEMVE